MVLAVIYSTWGLSPNIPTSPELDAAFTIFLVYLRAWTRFLLFQKIFKETLSLHLAQKNLNVNSWESQAYEYQAQAHATAFSQ